MQSNTYTAFLGFFMFIILNFLALPTALSQEEGDIFDLRFLTEVDCVENVLTATIQIRTQEDTFKIGISSVLFNYDENVLSFLDYESLNFDPNNVCIPGVPLAVWDSHQFSSSTPGVFNLTLLTEIASQSCPIIETDWIDIGTVRFSVTNMEATPNMQFDTRNTSFNRNEPNDGTFGPAQGDLIGFNEILSTQCAACEPPTLTTDILSFDCPQTSIEANLLTNDITSNPTISIINDPTRGTASITPNGVLTYTPSTTFCGEDALTYRVCNDGAVDCCAEAVVTISFADDSAPTFTNPPADLTIDCDALPALENIIATDNCADVEVSNEEVIVAGDCSGASTHMRTWTATDACGNMATHTQLISLIDNVEPTIECLETFSILCDEVGEAAIDSGQPNVSDNCTPENEITVSFSDEVVAETCENKIQKQIVRTWMAVDACGNAATCVQTINIIDDIPPVITCPANITVDCGQDIDPEVLESKATATDNCAELTISFEDSESMPLDCNFETIIITRTWTAIDACGNTTSCEQTITVIGSPCPDVTDRNFTVYRCEKDIVDFKAIIEASDNATINIANTSDFNPITNLQQYALPSTGCEIGEFEFSFEVFDAQQCLIDNGRLTIKTIPNFIGEAILEEEGCSANLILECPELYLVSWTAGEESGVGTTFTATPGTSGEVVFSVIFIGEILTVEAASLPCVEKLYRVNFNCESACPETENQQSNLTTCAGQTFSILERLDQIEDNLTYTFEFEEDIPGISFGETSSTVAIGNPFGCEMEGFNIIVNGYDDNQCLIKTINIAVQVLPKIEGTIQYESDSTFCAPQLVLECPQLYGIDWKDNLGNSGIGSNYTGTGGTSGLVTFFVYPIEENLSELPCAIDSFFADFNCPIICPSPVERTKDITACAATEIDIIEVLDLAEAKRFTFDNETIVEGIYQVGNPFGCEVGAKMLTIQCFDENDCLVERIILNITVLPVLFGEIQYETDSSFCNPRLILECSEAFEVTWADNLGNTGDGNLYDGAVDTAGFVTFYVRPIDTLNEICGRDTFFADFNCQSTEEGCPEPSFETIDLYGCDGEVLNLFERLAFSDNIRYRIVDGDGIEDIKNIRLENDGVDCFVRQFRLAIEVLDEQDCVTRTIFVSFNVLPEINGDIIIAEEGCGLNLELSCPNIYAISWEDNLGNTGEGFSYEPTEGTQGVVNFIVTYKDTTIADLLVGATCSRTTFSQEFACCNPIGTACDDGDALTFNDVEDGNCGCFGTGCNLENKGIVIDGGTLDACELLIEMSDGTILEPLILPVGETLRLGQEIIFSFVELTDRVSTCQAGKIVQLICLENNCPAEGTPCSDNNLATINDEEDGYCNCVGMSVPDVKGEIDLRFRPELDCQANTYCLTLQAKAQQEDFTIGTSSIMINYDSDALEFASYRSIQFDETETCIGGMASPWDEQRIDGTSVPGKFCLTMTLLTDSISCPEITTEEWEDIGSICFDIMNNETNELALKALLQGPYQPNKLLMADDLREKGFLPLTEPYTGIPSFVHFGEGGGETITLDILEDRGDDAIIDWVFLELRSNIDSTVVVATRSALIQSDGDIVDIDGVSNVRFVVPDDDYYVCIKHRNHLGVMSAEPIPFSTTETVHIDFTDAATPTYGNYAQLDVMGKMVLRGGNANPDKFIILAGGGLGLPDRDMIFFDIFLSLWQTNPDIPITYNSVLLGYYGSDTNMDGKVKYQGPKNDIDAYIFFNVLFHPQNTAFRLNFAISEQIP